MRQLLKEDGVLSDICFVFVNYPHNKTAYKHCVLLIENYGIYDIGTKIIEKIYNSTLPYHFFSKQHPDDYTFFKDKHEPENSLYVFKKLIKLNKFR